MGRRRRQNKDTGTCSILQSVKCQESNEPFFFFILNRLTVYYSCRYTLQLSSSTLGHVFTTYNCIHLAHFPLICILGCIHTVHMAHFPFHLYVATVLVFYSVAPIISVYSMWAFYVLLLWHANLPRGSIHPPKASVDCVWEVFVCTPSQSMSPLPAHSITPPTPHPTASLLSPNSASSLAALLPLKSHSVSRCVCSGWIFHCVVSEELNG